jgi:tyrosyl-tRNA synthetase
MEDSVKKLQTGTELVVSSEQLLKKLQSGKKLVIKLGADPTAPDLHLGHAVVLKKMRQFQDLGHQVVFLIGDFTARIGDPSGKSKTRPPLSQETIEQNTKTYFEQVGKVLDKSKLSIRYNSEWLSQLTFADVLTLCAKVTVAGILEREDFKDRLHKQQTIGFHELLYPIMQGYDSVALQADVELGGTDQTFNLLMGRTLQEHYNQAPQVIMTMPLLEGLDGVQKMSKSLGNYIGLTEPASQAYGKLMSLSDTMMWRYAALLLDDPIKTNILANKEGVASGSVHPMDMKKRIAYEIVASFWSSQESQEAADQFIALFQKKDFSQAQVIALPEGTASELWIVTLLQLLNVVKSSSEAKRLIENGSVAIDGNVIKDFKAMITWKSGTLVKAGKHFIAQLQ